MVRLETVKASNNFLGKLTRYKENVSPSNATVDPYDAESQILDFESFVPVLKTRQAGLKKASGRFQAQKTSPPLSEKVNSTVSKPTVKSECVPSKQPSTTTSLKSNQPLTTTTNPPAKRKSHQDCQNLASSSSLSPFSPLFCPPPQKRSSGGGSKEGKNMERNPVRKENVEPRQKVLEQKPSHDAKPIPPNKRPLSVTSSLTYLKTPSTNEHMNTSQRNRSLLSSSSSSSSSSSTLKRLAPLQALKASMDVSLTPVAFKTPRPVSHRRPHLQETPRGALEPLTALDDVPNALMKLLEETPVKTSHLLHSGSKSSGKPGSGMMVNVIVESASNKLKKTKRLAAQFQVFSSKDMLLSIARYLPGLELARLSLANVRIQAWLSEPNHRLWQNLCVANYKKFRFPKREEDSWKRRYLQSLEICEACDRLCPAGSPGAVIACISCRVQYCGFNPPAGHVRFPTTPSVKIAPRQVGMCYEQCWALCWRCNDLIVMQTDSGETGAVCRSCCPPDREVCEQCREAILLAHTKAQWETRRTEHKVARVLGLADPSMGEFAEIDDDGRSVASHYSGRYERAAPEENFLETSAMFDPYL